MTYAVVWSENGGPSFVGSLEIAGTCLVLSGTAVAAREACRRLPLAEVANAYLGRLSCARAGHDTGLVVGTASDRFEITSLEGIGALHELAERLAEGRGKAAP